jgi:hypothetical protein
MSRTEDILAFGSGAAKSPKVSAIPAMFADAPWPALLPSGLPGRVDPGVDVGGVEANEVAPFDEGDAAFLDEAADVADLDAEALGHGGDVDEVAGGIGLGQGFAPGVSVVPFHPPAKRVSEA